MEICQAKIQEDTDILASMKGIGKETAMNFLTEMGDNSLVNFISPFMADTFKGISFILQSFPTRKLGPLPHN
jgi:hypothetical protein